MRRIPFLVCAAALALSLTAGAAAGAPTQAHNYEAFEATCEVLGEVVIEVVNLGHWGTGKVQGTRLTLIPQFFAFTATNLDTGDTFSEEESKRNPHVDDVCHITFEFELEPGEDPFFPEGGTFLVEVAVGVKVVGHH